jgi:hypothetical protein
MATVTNTITLTSNDLTSDAISLSISNILSATKGGISRIPLATTAIAGATVLAPAAQYTEGAKIWLYNPAARDGSTANDRIYVSLSEAVDPTTGTFTTIMLKGGEWALLPWMGTTKDTDKNLEAYGSSGAMVIEFGIFQ